MPSLASFLPDPTLLVQYLPEKWFALHSAPAPPVLYNRERCRALGGDGNADLMMPLTHKSNSLPASLDASSIEYPPPLDATSSGWELDLPDIVPDVDFGGIDNAEDFFTSLLPRTSLEEVECLIPPNSPELPNRERGHDFCQALDIEVDLKMTGMFPICFDHDDIDRGDAGGSLMVVGQQSRHTSTEPPTLTTSHQEDLSELTEFAVLDMLDQAHSVEKMDDDDEDVTSAHIVAPLDAPCLPLLVETGAAATRGNEIVISKEALRWHPGFAAIARFVSVTNAATAAREVPSIHALPSAHGDAIMSISTSPHELQALAAVFGTVYAAMRAIANSEIRASISRKAEWVRVRTNLALALQAAERKSTKRAQDRGPSRSALEEPINPGGDADQRRGQKLNGDATKILRIWLTEHVDNPYPDEDEKDELALQTGLRIEQINNWFINARRRLLKRLKKP